ncbi:MAG TPA: hypothetical protein VFX31_06700, partial [Ktedonobacterales bacterium]|nr:hypothetical protein [Ktedonobacterales bacterium]
QPQPPQQGPQPMLALFDPKTIKAADYPPLLIGVMAVWCFIGIALMFVGAALPDTLGFILTLAQTIFILARDREGFYTGAGFFKVAEWGRGQRVALAIAEIPGYFLVLILYVMRVVALNYQRLQQPAPLTPPAKRKRPRGR